jgi:hypothetical protein
VSGYAWDQHTRGWTAGQWQRLIQPMKERGILWAFAPGNHDREVRIRQIIEIPKDPNSRSSRDSLTLYRTTTNCACRVILVQKSCCYSTAHMTSV